MSEQLAIPVPDAGTRPAATGWKTWPYPPCHLRWRSGDRRSICGIKDALPSGNAYIAETPGVWEPHWCDACIDGWERETGRVGTIPRVTT